MKAELTTERMTEVWGGELWEAINRSMDPVCEKREKALSDSTQFDEHLGILSVFSLTQSLFQSDFTSYNPEIKEKNQHISVIVGLLSDKSTKGKKKRPFLLLAQEHLFHLLMFS